jgi:hypothetical protein
MIFTMGFAFFYSYFVHIGSHKLHFKKIKKMLLKQNNYYNKHNPILKLGIEKYVNTLIKIVSFHKQKHHSFKKGNTNKNILYEFLILLFILVGVPILVVEFGKCIDVMTIVFFGILYTTVHTLNYSILSSFHETHHKIPNTNYGIDVMDHLFNTSYDGTIEDYNHYAINAIIITFLLYNI